jgi:hypothetical protein
MNRLQYAFAQIGNKSAKRWSESVLLDSDELPGGGWTLKVQRTWRNGVLLGRRSSQIGRRAYHAGTFIAIRSFEQEFPSRWLMIEVVPAASAVDAEMVLPELQEFIAPSLGSALTISEYQVRDVEVPGIINPWTYEAITAGIHGPNYFRYIAGRVRNVVFLVGCAGHGDLWSWLELAEIAKCQHDKVQLVFMNITEGQE